MKLAIKIREFKEFDLDECLSLFYDTVHTVNATDYSQSQLDVWARKVPDKGAWKKRLIENITCVAVYDKQIVGFGSMTQQGHFDLLFVHKNFQRKRVARNIVIKLEETAKQLGIKEITAEASITAKPFSESMGYHVVREQLKEFQGEKFTNFVMKKVINSDAIKEKIESFPIYHVDAFTDSLFSGNPAAVCILPMWLSDDELHAIAKENNLPVTAFVVRADEKFHIRWITPEYELNICGHGSLAAGHVILNYIEPTLQRIDLQSCLELLPVLRSDDLITLNFPAKLIEKCDLPLLEQALNVLPKEIYKHRNERCLAVYHSEEEVKQLKPDIAILKKLEHRGITVTAPGKDVDFVSRTFYPHKTIYEDPATGASHCLLAPYWSERLEKTKLHARQVSERGGEIFCEYKDNRVLISGKAALYMQGIIALK